MLLVQHRYGAKDPVTRRAFKISKNFQQSFTDEFSRKSAHSADETLNDSSGHLVAIALCSLILTTVYAGGCCSFRAGGSQSRVRVTPQARMNRHRNKTCTALRPHAIGDKDILCTHECANEDQQGRFAGGNS